MKDNEAFNVSESATLRRRQDAQPGTGGFGGVLLAYYAPKWRIQPSNQIRETGLNLRASVIEAQRQGLKPNIHPSSHLQS